ncbi:opioid growth factor receptor isoform X2 [Sorex araneus]|uniref:opioid growth factor receptor isoform X2 n=1 Tax=Sorex araneus TaxID=42254 RepID=UPI0003314D13|nr:opioid growth factor receptor isoform X2 [Sorex araneus]
MDDPACDSTWDDSGEEDGEATSAGDDADDDGAAPGDADPDGEAEQEARPAGLQPRTPRNWRAMRDTARYRRHYPGLRERDGNGDMPNLSFYRNEIRFQPHGHFIEDILQSWKDDYERLEDDHSYIQWLFPLREPGVNWHAKPLTLQEIQAFRSCPEVQGRLVRAYELMLGFYGIRLEDSRTGRLRRAHNYLSRFQNLNSHSHNNLRLTRILKSLGELGLEHLQAPLARFFLEETLVRGQLPSVRQSALDYFVFSVRCRQQRRRLLRFAWEHFRPRALFVWAPHARLQRLPPPEEPTDPEEEPAREDGQAVPGSPPPAHAPAEAPPDVPPDAPADPSADAQADEPSNLTTDAPSDVPADATAVAPSDVPANAPADVPSDVPADVPPNVPGNAPPDAPADATPNAPPDDAPSSVPPNMLSDMPPCVAPHTGPDLLTPELDPDPDPALVREAGDISPKESKKRKLEGSRAHAPAKPEAEVGVESVTLHLEGFVLSQASPGDQDAGEVVPPGPEPSTAPGSDEVRKRRKVGPATEPPVGSPESRENADKVQEKAEGQAGPRPGGPASPPEP